jgi:hypothetical protein
MPSAHSLNGMNRYTIPSLDESVESENTAYFGPTKPRLKTVDNLHEYFDLLVAQADLLLALSGKLKDLRQVVEFRGAECKMRLSELQRYRQALEEQTYANEG